MDALADVDMKTNFRLQGIVPGYPDPVEISTRGFATRYRVGSSTGILSRLQPADVGDVRISTSVNSVGYTAVVQFQVVNSGDSSATFSLCLDTEVFLNRQRFATITRLDDLGFRIVSGLIQFQVFDANYPMATTRSTDWFGPSSQLEQSLWTQTSQTSVEGEDLAFAITWQNRVVEAHGTASVSVVMTWGEAEPPPEVQVEGTHPPENVALDYSENVTIDYTIDNFEPGGTVFLAVDGDMGNLIPVTVTPNGHFTVSFNGAALNLQAGSHQFQVYHVSPGGSITTVDSFVAAVLAPTLRPTSTPSESQSPTATPTESASWGEIIDVPWFENEPLDTANEGVNPITVGKIVIGVGIPIGVIMVVGFGFLLAKYRRAVREDMDQRLKSASASEAGEMGMVAA
jgi:hypothetical protein